MCDAIILDVDGTIWNTTEIVSVAWNKAIDSLGYHAQKVNAQVLQKEFGKTMEVIALDLWPNLNSTEREVLLSRCCSEEQEALRQNTLDITYPTVKETVQEMSARHPFFVVSNCQSGYIELMLQKTGLAPYIQDFECYGRTKKGKTDNLLLLIARNNIKAPVYVGDTQGDADSCKQAHVPFVWASYGFGVADFYKAALHSFSDLKYILS